MAVTKKLSLQGIKLFGGAVCQSAVNRPGSKKTTVCLQLGVGLLPQPTDRALQRRDSQVVEHLLHRDIAGQTPERFVPAAAQPGVAKEAVKQAVQVGALQIASIVAVQPQRPGSAIEQLCAIRGQSALRVRIRRWG